MGRAFFPLDEELGLLAGQYTPQLQETMTRLGGKLPFAEAAEEVWRAHGVAVTETTLRRTCQRHAAAAEAVARATVETLEATAPAEPAGSDCLLVSADGSFIPLTDGAWCEVKSVAVGEVARAWAGDVGQVAVTTGHLSYFSRSYPIRDFERYALAELHGRGVSEAATVVAVNDGAAWVQSFVDYHCPRAVRVIDFAHAAGYLATAGKAVLGEGTDAFQHWFGQARHDLKHATPRRTLGRLALLEQQATTAEQVAAVDCARRYLHQRQAMVDYPHFRRRGLPIGSGAVESSHKQVVQRRLKGPGMRWAPAHVNPLLAIRNLICNARWDAGWAAVVAHQRRRAVAARRHTTPSVVPVPPPLTFASLAAAGQLPDPLPDDPPAGKRQRPKPDHPWRQPDWLTRHARPAT